MSSAADGLDFLVDRSDFHQVRFDLGPALEPGDGQVLFRVDRFALTANNISYAKTGDMLRYWDFFPAPEGWGRIPAMGFGDVVASRHPDVAEGERVFGFFPMSRQLVVTPSAAQGSVIFDGAAHREGIAPVYATYNRSDQDPFYEAAHEDALMLMRGLFMTSFLVDDAMGEESHHGAEQVIVGSASSKTGIALAFLLASAGRARVIGLTSPRNAAFVKSLGHYDEVVHYDDLESIQKVPSAFVDMAGDGDVTNRLHRHLGEQMKYSCQVGATHWEALARDEELPGATPEFFFAPGQIQKRSKDWGPGELAQRIGDSWKRFRASTDAWLRVERGTGAADLERVYRATLEGRVTPDTGQVLSLQDAS